MSGFRSFWKYCTRRREAGSGWPFLRSDAGSEDSAGSSFDLAARSSGEEMPGAWLHRTALTTNSGLAGVLAGNAMPKYLDDLEGVGPTLAAAIVTRGLPPARSCPEGHSF